MRKDWKREYFSIPNLLGYFRIILLPVFLYIYSHAASKKDYVTAFVILLVSFLSDFVDGKIARRFNMITQFGKMLDPFADKLTQGVLAIAVAMNYPLMWAFVILFALKEAYMAYMGMVLLKKRGAWEGAQMFGKVCTTLINFGVMALLLFPGISSKAGNVIIIVLMISAIYTWIRYIFYHRSLLRTEA